MDLVYLDHNATTPVLPAVLDAMLPWLREGFGNPSSSHLPGRRARRAVDRAREQVAALIGATPEEIVFTSGGTESNNLAIFGVTEARPDRRRVVTSRVEHPATLAPCAALEARGWTIDRLPVDPGGRVRADEARLDDDVSLLTVMLAHNETGVVQPVPELAAAARAVGATVHTDAAQAVGKVEVQVDALGVDLLSVAGHKLHAPKGVGALYVRRGTPIVPFLRGAGQELGLRPGTENVASIVGLGEACRIAQASMHDEARRLADLRDRLWERLSSEVPDLRRNGDAEHVLPNTLHVSFPDVRGTDLLARAWQVAASTGSACHAGEEHPAQVLVEMGLDEQTALGAVRLSLGRDSDERRIDLAATALVEAWKAR